MQTHDRAMLFLNVFGPNSPPAFTIATFNIRAYGAENNTAVITAIKQRLQPEMKLMHHIDSTFKVKGTAISIFNTVAFVMVEKPVTIEVCYDLCKAIAAERPIIGADYIRAWSVGVVPPVGDMFRIPPRLTDTEVRTLGIQHPEIENRAWFGRDEDGKPILRTAIVGSTEEIEGRSPPESDDDEQAASSSGAAGGDGSSGAAPAP
jgi:hypothetical protein